MLFADRVDAGQQLAEALHHLEREHPVVLGLPRGGVPVAFQVAQTLGADLDVIVVRKLGVPHHEEVAFGAIGEGGVRVVNEDVAGRLRGRQAGSRGGRTGRGGGARTPGAGVPRSAGHGPRSSAGR